VKTETFKLNSRVFVILAVDTIMKNLFLISRKLF